jgi:hypothetical protein
MQRLGTVAGRCVFMCDGGVFHDADNFPFGQDFAIIQGKQKRLADRKGGGSVNIMYCRHWVSTFFGFSVRLQVGHRGCGA